MGLFFASSSPYQFDPIPFDSRVYRFARRLFASLFLKRKQFICIFVAIYCDFYSIIVDRQMNIPRQRAKDTHKKNENAVEKHSKKREGTSKQTTITAKNCRTNAKDMAVKMQMFAFAQFRFVYFRWYACLLVFILLVLTYVLLTPLASSVPFHLHPSKSIHYQNTNLWSDIKQISLVVFTYKEQ